MKEKKVVIITGASKGIGRAAARLFAARGHTVYGFSRGGFDLDGVHSVICDIRDNDRFKEAVADVYKAEGRVDIFVNNAGMGISGAVERTDILSAEKLFALNFFPVAASVAHIAPIMRNSGGGKIVNICSVAGALHIPFQAFYSASKAAEEALTNALRGELKPFKIKVTAVMPGDTKTAFTENREKEFDGADPDYKDRITKSIAMMERDERHGMPPEKVAKVIYKAAKKRNPKPAYVVGFKYKFFMLLNKILPKRIVQAIINKIYAK